MCTDGFPTVGTWNADWTIVHEATGSVRTLVSVYHHWTKLA